MKTYPLNEARADFSKLVEKALSGEPCRITRYGKEAVVVVSEEIWLARTNAAPTLGALLANFARGEIFDDEASDDSASDRPWTERPLGADIE